MGTASESAPEEMHSGMKIRPPVAACWTSSDYCVGTLNASDGQLKAGHGVTVEHCVCVHDDVVAHYDYTAPPSVHL
ncbi:hypothetical protein EYF80_028348 [Liparis tanakae]|uniref:Uncharacterized protein n=1 Tax=Liparis tanakae TaxID=230148 RepID=A0A4Z2H6Q9_9TELE|nr:hypothetical protein EYF80_028348 [Liparis tanakae]